MAFNIDVAQTLKLVFVLVILAVSTYFFVLTITGFVGAGLVAASVAAMIVAGIFCGFRSGAKSLNSGDQSFQYPTNNIRMNPTVTSSNEREGNNWTPTVNIVSLDSSPQEPPSPFAPPSYEEAISQSNLDEITVVQ